MYWLQGIRLEYLGHKNEDGGLLTQAYQKYLKANEITFKAQELFDALVLDRGIVKSWGNLGNATKELVKYALRLEDFNLANENISKAYDYYVQNAEGGISISRKDEISHGYWGIAELYEIFAKNSQIHIGASIGDRKTLLKKSFWYAKESHNIYTSLGGTKDINATKRIVERLKQELGVDEET